MAITETELKLIAMAAIIGLNSSAIAGILLFGESREAIRLLFIGLIVAGVVGVKLTQ